MPPGMPEPHMHAQLPCKPQMTDDLIRHQVSKSKVRRIRDVPGIDQFCIEMFVHTGHKIAFVTVEPVQVPAGTNRLLHEARLREALDDDATIAPRLLSLTSPRTLPREPPQKIRVLRLVAMNLGVERDRRAVVPPRGRLASLREEASAVVALRLERPGHAAGLHPFAQTVLPTAASRAGSLARPSNQRR